MKSYYLSILFFLITGIFSANAQNTWQWANTADSPGSTFGEAVTTDAAGNVFTAGNFTGFSATWGDTTLNNTVGANSLFLLKYNSDGNLLWAKGPDGPVNSGRIFSLATDSEGAVYTVGTFSGTLVFGSVSLTSVAFTETGFLAKFDGNGNIIWATTTGTQAYTVLNKIIVKNDLLYLSGYYSSPFTFNGISLAHQGANDIMVAAFNLSGTIQWAINLGGSGQDTPEGLTADDNGNVYVSGTSSSTSLSFGSSVISGSTYDTLLAKISAGGIPVWAKGYGAGPTFESGYGIASDSNGNIYSLISYSAATNIEGSTVMPSGGEDFAIIKYNAEGNVQWVRTGNGSYTDIAVDIAVNAQDNIIIAGTSNSPSVTISGEITNLGTGFNNIFVAGLNSSGDLQWVEYTSAENNSMYAFVMSDIAVHNNDVYITGMFPGVVNFGDIALNGIYMTYTAKLLVDNTAGISENNKILMLYPNPVKDTVNIPGNSDGQFTITDLMGRTVARGSMQANVIDVSSLPSGIYLLNINNTTTKFIKG